MKKVLLLFFIPILFLSSSCGKEEDHAIGRYYCRQLIVDGEAAESDGFFSDIPALELKSGGKASLTMNGITSEGSWENKDNSLSLLFGDNASVAKLENGTFTIDIFGKGITYCFFKNESDSQYSEEFCDESRNNKWSGEWYGYWCINNASGIWENMDGQQFDCFADIFMGLDDEGSIYLWDEKSSRMQPMAETKLRLLASEDNGYGTALAESGYFFERNIENGEWVISPDEQNLPNLIVISSVYDSADGKFSYSIFLRPWGYLWDDAEDGGLMLPYHYNTFYIPMITEKRSMPDRIESFFSS